MLKKITSKYIFDPLDFMNPSEKLDELNINNFLDGIRVNAQLNADILSGHKSTLLCQLGNIALRTGTTLNIDPTNGHIKNDPAASKFWSREYQPGWEPKI